MRLKRLYNKLIAANGPVLLIIPVYILTQVLFISDYNRLELVGVTSVHICIALSLLYINQLFIVIKTKTFLPSFFYLLFVGTQPAFVGDFYPALSAICMLFSVFALFTTYQNAQSQSAYFVSGIALSLGSLFWPPFFFFFPLLWRSGYHFQSLNLRTFIASLLGFAFVYLGLFTYSIYNGDLSLFLSFFSRLDSLIHIQLLGLNWQEILSVGFLLILFILASINLYFPGRGERIKTLHYLGHFSHIGALSIVGFIVLNQWSSSWLSIFFLGASFLLTHLFLKKYSKFLLFALLFTILLLVAVFIAGVFFDLPVLSGQ